MSSSNSFVVVHRRTVFIRFRRSTRIGRDLAQNRLAMRLSHLRYLVVVGLLFLCTYAAPAATPIEYRLSFPDAVHHVMRVEVVFRDLRPGALQIRMSRSTPGRYSAFEFAKNVFSEHITDGRGRPLIASRLSPREWKVANHDGTVRVTYNVFGNKVDGTFLAVDLTHAHINFPAALMWSPDLAQRPAEITFVPPVGSGWKVETQLTRRRTRWRSALRICSTLWIARWN
jgi:hypothetical protein